MPSTRRRSTAPTPWSTPAPTCRRFTTTRRTLPPADLAQLHTWNGLLNPKWKGKIVLGDVAAGVDESDIAPSWVSLGQSFFSPLLSTMNVSVEPSGDDLQMANGLARGQWDFALFPRF